jgi:hypothetical protein
VRKMPLCLSGLVLLLIFAGCGANEESLKGQESASQAKMPPPTASGPAANEAVVQQKMKYKKITEEKLADLNQKMAELKSKATAVSGEEKAMINEQLDSLSKESDNIYRMLEKIKYASVDTWPILKAKITESFNKLKVDYDETAESLNKALISK